MRFVFHSFLIADFEGEYFLNTRVIAPAARSLTPFVLSASLIRCKAAQVYHHLSIWSAQLLMYLLSRLWEPNPPKYPVTHFSQRSRRPDYSLSDLQLYGLPEDPLSLNVAAILRLGPLFNCCIRGPSVICSQPSILHDRVTASLMPCGNKAGRLAACSGQLLPGPTTVRGQFLRLSAARCRSPYWSSSSPIVFTFLYSLRAIRCSATTSVASGFASKHVTSIL
jgi:hypothetical protein